MPTSLTLAELRYSVKIHPIEVSTFLDGSEQSRRLHSDHDKTYGGKNIITATDSDRCLEGADYLTTTTGVKLEHGATDQGLGTVEFLLIRIASAGSTGTPNCLVAVDGGTNYNRKLTGVGDFMILRLADVDSDDIYFKCDPTSANAANINIFSMGNPIYFLDADSKYFVVVGEGTDATAYFRIGD